MPERLGAEPGADIGKAPHLARLQRVLDDLRPPTRESSLVPLTQRVERRVEHRHASDLVKRQLVTTGRLADRLGARSVAEPLRRPSVVVNGASPIDASRVVLSWGCGNVVSTAQRFPRRGSTVNQSVGVGEQRKDGGRIRPGMVPFYRPCTVGSSS